MKRTIRNIILWPFRIMAEFTAKVYHTLYYFSHKEIARKDCINRLQPQRQGRTLLRILGNGKSLSDDLAVFASNEQTDYMVVNRHVLSDSYQVVKPRYYTLADSYFYTMPEGYSILQHIDEETQWDMFLFVPNERAARDAMNLYIRNQHITVVYYNAGTYEGFDCMRRYMENHNLSMPVSQNVVVAGVYIAICMQYPTIELYGVEHSWTRNLSVNEDNEVCLENPHFYDGKGQKVQTQMGWNLHVTLNKYARMFESYWELNALAEKRKVRIINKTKDSFIDAFPKK